MPKPFERIEEPGTNQITEIRTRVKNRSLDLAVSNPPIEDIDIKLRLPCAKYSKHGSTGLRHADFKIFATLGNPIQDPHHVFKRIGASRLVNLDGLFYWLGTKSDHTDWLGTMVTLLAICLSDNESTMLSLTSYLVLRRLASITNDPTDALSALRAKDVTFAELRQQDKVTNTLLVVIAMLALMAAGEGDIASAQTHLEALAMLRPQCQLNVAEWLFVSGCDVRVASSLSKKPVLPWFKPADAIIDPPFWLPANIVKTAHERAARNLDAMSQIVGDSHDIVLKALKGMYVTLAAEIHGPTDWGQVLEFGWHVTYFLGECAVKHGSDVPSGHQYAQKRLLSISMGLLSWRAAAHCVPTEGVIQFRLLESARELVEDEQDFGNFCQSWSETASVEALAWVLGILVLESSIFLAEDVPFWSSRFRRALLLWRPQQLSFEILEEHISRWLYPGAWFAPLSSRLWQLVMGCCAETSHLGPTPAFLALPLNSRAPRLSKEEPKDMVIRGPRVKSPLLL